MKRFETIVKTGYLFALAVLLGTTTLAAAPANPGEYEFTDEEVRDHMTSMNTIVKPRYTSEIRAHLFTYIKHNREKTQTLLDRSMLYFPAIERYLDEHNMPQDLKYLTIVESSLNPHAYSRVGAVGLWQFMSYTGREFGLRVSRSVDERRDVHRSTIAAIEYLNSLYETYGDWALALSAYNCGPGRVNEAIRRSGSRDFWTLSRYLPRETRGYVPAYLAATYVFKNYDRYGFQAQRPESDLFFTEPVQVFQYITLSKVAEVTALDLARIKLLNPAFRHGYIPRSSLGYFITLPSRVVPAFQRYLNEQEQVESTELGENTDYLVAKEEEIKFVLSRFAPRETLTLEELGNIFRIDPYQIKYWNGLRLNVAPFGVDIEIPVFTSKGRMLLSHYKRMPAVDFIEIGEMKLLEAPANESTAPIEAPQLRSASSDNFPFHVLQRGESFADIMRQRRRSEAKMEAFFENVVNKRDGFPLTYGLRISVNSN